MISSDTVRRNETLFCMESGSTQQCKRFAGKRVAMVSFSPYPFDPRVRRAADALIGGGAIIDLICIGSENTPGREILNGIEVLRVPLNKQERGGKLKYLYRYAVFILIATFIFALRAMTRGYDLVYVHNMPDVLVVCSLIPKALRAKVILDIHDPMPELMMTIFSAKRESWSVRLLKSLEKWSLARADLVLTVNIACKRLLSSRSCNTEKIGVVMNSPDGQIFPFRCAQLGTFARAEGRSFVVMYHGSLLERNGLDLAVDALARIRETVPTVELRIYGHATPFLERVMESARNKSLDGMVRYLGPKRLEDLVLEIENCDVGIIPNHRSAFTKINTPTRIFEYLILGKPVIAPRTPGIQDYFGPESLFFFDSGNADQLAERIEYVFSHPAEAVETTERGQSVYLAHTWRQERQTLVHLIDGLLNGGITDQSLEVARQA